MTDRELIAGWLLALLNEHGHGYGYDLRLTLRTRGVQADPATVYRTLRALDRDGMLRSLWAPPTDGPRRRIYSVTDAGRDHLAVLAREAKASRAALSEFLRSVPSRPEEPE